LRGGREAEVYAICDCNEPGLIADAIGAGLLKGDQGVNKERSRRKAIPPEVGEAMKARQGGTLQTR
jgi:hypothetical protein